MKKYILPTVAIFFYLIYGLYLAQYDVAILSEDLKAENPHGFLDYRGITDVRPGDLNEVIASAQGAGLDFLSVTDLNVFDKPTSLAGYHNNLLVMVDGEYSYLNSRLLNIGATTTRHLQGVGRSQVLFADLLSQPHKDPDLGILILARPNNPRYRWTGVYPPGLDGLEVINLKDVWNESWAHKRWSFLWSLFVYPFHEKLALLRLFETPEEETNLWDELSQKRRMIGIAGAGAEGKMRFPTYETLFSLVRDHVLLRSEFTGNTASDLEKLSNAIRQGQFYMSLDILGNPKGFNALVRTKSGTIYPMGSEMKFEEGLTLEVTLPQKPKVPFDTVIYRNGEKMMTSNSQVTQYYVNSPGVYRVLVRVIPTLPLPDGKKWIPWIYTNMFHVQSKSEGKVSGIRTTMPSSGGS
ncbi:MAG: hypothetical protein ACXVA9_00515 [Bdellovibrionales bacterium]